MHAACYVCNLHNYHVPQKRKLNKGKKVFSKKWKHFQKTY